jgi:hypothetical protein
VQLGTETVVFASKNTTVASQIKVRGTSYLQFFVSGGSALDGAVGRSSYLQLSQTVRGLEAGDLLDLFTTSPYEANQTLLISAISGTLLTLATPLPVLPVWAFGTNLSLPFARLRTGHSADFTALKTGLETWLAQRPQTEAYFTDLYRYINPLLSNAVPSAAEVGDALAQVRALQAQLTRAAALLYGGPIVPLETVLRNYKAAPLPPVDALLRSFKEKGADRAVDLLLAGDFQAFFGVTDKTSSYGGYFQETLQAVASNDFPVRKDNRADSHRGRLVASTETPDPEYNLADTEGQGVRPDPV